MAKYDKWRKPENLILLIGWARDGLTDEEIAKKMAISVSTLYDWKKKFSEISEALKKGKDVVDNQVENALLKKALGHTVKVKKPFKLKEVKYNLEGKRIAEKEHIVYAQEDVYIPPDTTAQIFWLKNRRYKKWRDKPIETTNSEDNTQINIIINEAKKEMEE